MAPWSKQQRRALRPALVAIAATALFTVGSVTAPHTASAYVPAGVPLTPPMGFNSWYNFNEHYTADDIGREADAVHSKGLDSLGYVDVGLDGGWWSTNRPTTGRDATTGRDPSGNIVPDAGFLTATYPTMKSLTDHIHSLGLKAGVYTDTGSPHGCGAAFGSGGHENQDAQQFAAWGFDYVKLDHCGGNVSGRTTAQTYAYWRTALDGSGRTMSLEICEWGQEMPWNWGAADGRTWRTGSDITGNNANGTGPFPRSHLTWADVIKNFDFNDHPSAAGPGHYNDPDYLLIGGFGLTSTEEQSYFGMWAIEAAPLVLATDVANMTASTQAVVTNPEVIAVDQDSAGKQGTVVSYQNGLEVLSKPLSTPGTRAVLLLNRSASASAITVNFADLGLSGTLGVRDLYARQDLGTATGSYTSVSLPSHGSVMLKLTGGTEVTPPAPAPVNVVVRGADGAAWIKSYTGGGWTNFSSLSGEIVGSPTVATTPDGTVHVFAQGIDSPSNIWQDTETAGVWSGWSKLAGTSGATGPSATVDPTTGALDLYWRGSDTAVWQETLTNGTWSAATSLGGEIKGAPAAVASADGTIRVFARGLDDALWEDTYAGGGWNWITLGGTMSDSPAVAIDPIPNVITVFERHTDGTVYTATWSVSAWTGLVSVGGPTNNTFTGAPAAVALPNEQVDLFVQGTDNALWQQTEFAGSWSTWSSLGGVLSASPAAG